MTHSVHVDMEVSPNSLVMIGRNNNAPDNTVYEGKNVTVTCIASGAQGSERNQDLLDILPRDAWAYTPRRDS